MIKLEDRASVVILSLITFMGIFYAIMFLNDTFAAAFAERAGQGARRGPQGPPGRQGRGVGPPQAPRGRRGRRRGVRRVDRGVRREERIRARGARANQN